MRTLQEVEAFCQVHLADELRQLDQDRKTVLTRATASTAMIAVAGVATSIFIAQYTGTIFALPVCLVLTAVVCAVVFARIVNPYKLRFKHRIIGRLIGFIEEGLQYQPKGLIPIEQFKASRIFRSRIDRYRGEDLVYGRVGRTDVRFSEVHAEYKTTSTDSKGHTHTHWHTIFRGVFFIADFNKDFRGRTLVLPDTAERLFGHFGQKLQAIAMPRMELVRLEDRRFEREFVVYGDDQIEARYILTPSLMDRILQLKDRTGRTIYLSFADSKVYLAISTGENILEPRLSGCLADPSIIQRYYQQIASVLRIVDDLNLNIRIWSRQ